MGMSGHLIPMLLLSSVAYHGLNTAHSVWQRRFAGRPEALDSPLTTSADFGPDDDFRPTVDVIVTCMNEDVGLLERCLRSVESQQYPAELVQVFIIDDGSRNLGELEPVYRRYSAKSGWTVVRAPRNRGKRLAQGAAYNLGFGDLVLMVDSDTVITPYGLATLASRFARPDLGSLCSNIKVLNERVNWLTRALKDRYELLFDQERAAQGHFGAVLCCAGPFAMFRRAALEAELELRSHWGAEPERATVWEHYLRQRAIWLRDVHFVSGDDLHLTHLVLLAEYRSEYEPAAVAHTQVPETLGHFRRQQQRWNRSMYRELPWTIALLLRRRQPYLWLDSAGRMLLPLLLMALFAAAAAAAAVGGPQERDLAAVAVASVVLGHWLCLPLEHRGLRFFVSYGVVYVFLLLPAKLYGLLTPLAGSWGTRKVPTSSSQLADAAPSMAGGPGEQADQSVVLTAA